MLNNINTALQLHRDGNFDAARDIYEKIILNNPDDFNAHHYLGVLYQQTFNYKKSIELISHAITINPKSAEANYNLGISFFQLNQFVDAVAAYDRAITLKKDFPQAHHNRGNALRNLHYLQEAILSYDLALKYKPDHIEAKLNKAIALLLAGRYEEAWPLYEFRLHGAEAAGRIRKYDQPKLNLDYELQSKTVYLYAEQGYGDSIQFLRYLPLLKHRNAQLIVSVQNCLIKLFTDSFGDLAIFIQEDKVPVNFDYYCALPSLPYVFNTSLNEIPSRNAYLKADDSKEIYWKGMLGPKTRNRVGLAWSGNPHHRNDKNRSIALSNLLENLPPVCQYVSLQKDLKFDELVLLEQKNVLHFERELLDFSDTAALVKNLDLVITVDSSPVHLSAALGVPTYLLLPYAPDWRWMLNVNKSLWYDSITLYRQSELSQWDDVLNKLSMDVINFKINL